MEPICMWMLVAGILAVVHCQPLPDCEGNNKTEIYLQDETHSETPLPCHKISTSNTIFALRLYKELTSAAPNENIFFSPVSISMALAMLSLGTQATVQTQILEGLGFNLTEIPESEIYKSFQHLIHKLNLSSKKHELKVGSFMILDKQLKPLHEWHSNKELYEDTTFTINFTNFFSTRTQINKYIENQTYGKIREFLQDFTQDAVMVLVNSIFFKAKWMHPFKHYWVKKRLSSSADEKILRPAMMHQKAQHRFLYDKELACIVLQMEYIEDVLILLVLPDEGKMGQVEDSLKPETLKKWNKLLLPSLLNLQLPKFSISGAYSLEEILPKMGFSSIFSPEVNLSNITEPPRLTISKLLHQVAVDMNEKGTKAAATSTFLSQPETLSQASPLTVHFDRPFLLLIWEVSAQSLLFLGKIITPTAS
ncbi:serpin A11-like [Petaurus breviceps papuanus]|uniref:serpin A11-like n=1 Tax=Petaurus breviceps papuanus TaxID=3040969 RepID=UPI0036DDA224